MEREGEIIRRKLSMELIAVSLNIARGHRSSRASGHHSILQEIHRFLLGTVTFLVLGLRFCY